MEKRYIDNSRILTTRVNKPDEDNWMKLKMCLKYLEGTKHMKLAISVDSL